MVKNKSFYWSRLSGKSSWMKWWYLNRYFKEVWEKRIPGRGNSICWIGSSRNTEEHSVVGAEWTGKVVVNGDRQWGRVGVWGSREIQWDSQSPAGPLALTLHETRCCQRCWTKSWHVLALVRSRSWWYLTYLGVKGLRAEAYRPIGKLL